MTHDLAKLIEMARKVEMTDGDREAQRRSFVYGNTHIENERITRATIDRAAATIAGERRG
jgi:hypothetical protein